VQDVLVRLDISLGKLLDYLDKQVGAGNYVLALSSDHGVADIPEQAQNGGRQPIAAVREAIDAAIRPTLGGEGSYIAYAANEVYFKPGVYDRLKANPTALRAAVTAAQAMSGIARVLTSDEVSGETARSSKDPLIRAAALSYFPGRSGDLLLVTKENWMLAASGTTHGSPYPYDQRVPVLLYGAGIVPGVRDEPASPADLAATIAPMVGVRLPSPDGRVLSAALKTR
jgi:predicted AlkP superfamily pyrophosphatase or phosphodiesterase